MKRAELSDLRAEYGILSRTEEILKAKDAHLLGQLNTMEAQMGVSGFHETQDTMEKVSSLKASVDARKGQSLEDMSGMVMELNRKVAERKSHLAPIIKGEIVLIITSFRIESADTWTYGDTLGAWHSIHHYDLCILWCQVRVPGEGAR
ncbi:Intraflagellar transport protein 81 [Chionoecetes opilio]|uniref:Intraflagellar transport protein 81 n=1 Tax=Chionoecetes opilio TaxID=41210 RepID=A0A8J4Y2J2_CHIOP|nr:Intraflagellar transport protein 81 [Chionoecetes opilio]